MGLWLASHERLRRYIKHPLWKKQNLLDMKIEDKYVEWKYAEKSNGGLLFVDVPKGFWTTNVVPYDPIKKILLPIGHVSHERNGYSKYPFIPFSKIEVEDLFRPNGKNVALS